jgi:hypothetical protein
MFGKTITFNFYGYSPRIEISNEIISVLNDCNKHYSNLEEIELQAKDFYYDLDDVDYEKTLSQLTNYKKKYELDDYGFLLLIDKFLNELTLLSNQRTLLEWFILSKNNYDVLLGINNNAKYILLCKEDDNVLNMYSYIIDNKEYFNLKFNNDNNLNYLFHFTPNEGQNSFTLGNSLPLLKKNIEKKNISFLYLGNSYTYQININLNITNYLDDLPMINFGKHYINFGFSKPLKRTLLTQLEKDIKNFDSIVDKLNFLLFFTQIIPYKVDKTVHGKEHWAFPEQAIYLNYLDCEDKSILFAYLVWELLEIKSVLYIYKSKTSGHANVGIAIDNLHISNPDKKIINGIEYIICEPTNIGYKLGEQLKLTAIFKFQKHIILK